MRKAKGLDGKSEGRPEAGQRPFAWDFAPRNIKHLEVSLIFKRQFSLVFLGVGWLVAWLVGFGVGFASASVWLVDK